MFIIAGRYGGGGSYKVIFYVDYWLAKFPWCARVDRSLFVAKVPGAARLLFENVGFFNESPARFLYTAEE